MSHPWNPKLRKSMATEDNTSLRVASFSCYLDTAKENLVHVSAKDTKKLSLSTNSQETPSFSFLNTSGEKFAFKVSGPLQDPAPAFSFPQETPIPINLEGTKCKDGEIGVFGADKYFNVKLDGRVRVEEPPAGSRNPSVCSQESDLKSQNVLLQRRRRIESKKKQKRLFGRSFCAGLVCQGSCFGEKSVRGNEIVAPGTTIESKPTRTESKRVDHFAFQVPSCRAENLTVEEEELKEEKQNDPRISLEVFGSYSSSTKGGVARNLERKLSMLTWDAIPNSGQNLKISTPGNTTICDDLASDASSDLFEIENISSISYSKLKVESDLDHMSSFTSPSPTKYAPSEASIEWSVVTASAADYSSVISDYDEKKVSVAADRISRKIDRNSADYWDPRIIIKQ